MQTDTMDVKAKRTMKDDLIDFWDFLCSRNQASESFDIVADASEYEADDLCIYEIFCEEEMIIDENMVDYSIQLWKEPNLESFNYSLKLIFSNNLVLAAQEIPIAMYEELKQEFAKTKDKLEVKAFDKRAKLMKNKLNYFEHFVRDEVNNK